MLVPILAIVRQLNASSRIEYTPIPLHLKPYLFNIELQVVEPITTREHVKISQLGEKPAFSSPAVPFN